MLEKYECCPSFRQEQTERSPAAEEGTLLHECVATNNSGLLSTEEQVELFNRCLIIRAQVDAAYSPQAKRGAEVQVKLEGLTQGTTDYLVTDGRLASIIDWKFGKIPATRAEKNIQGQAYAAAVMETFPELEAVEVTIYQPRIELLTKAVFSRNENLANIKLRILSIIARATAEQKEETPSEQACLFCTRKGECKALKAIAQKVGVSLNLPVPIELNPSGIMRPADMSKLQILSHVIEDWAKQVRQNNAKRAIEDGIEVPGFEIRSREGAFEVTDLVSAVKLLEEYGIPLERILQACTLSLPKVTEQAFALKGGKKKDLREAIEEVIKAYLVRGEQIVFLQKKKGMTYEDILKECRE